MGDAHHEAQRALQRTLSARRQSDAADGELQTLVGIARQAATEGDPGRAGTYLDLAAKRIRLTRVGLDRLHEVLGERAQLLLAQRRHAQAVDLGRQAIEAARAHGQAADAARWIGCVGAMLRAAGEAESARRHVEEARARYATLGEAGRPGVAEQEGQLGLLAVDSGDEDEALACFTRATDLAETAGDDAGIARWATRLGEDLAGRRRYREAWSAHRRAIDAARRCRDGAALAAAARAWAVGLRRAHRDADAAALLIAVADEVADPRTAITLLDLARSDLRANGDWGTLAAVDGRILGSLRSLSAPAEALAAYLGDQQRVKALATAAQTQATPLLQARLADILGRTSSRDVDAIADTAHLVCDVELALAFGGGSWEALHADREQAHDVVHAAMAALAEAGRAEDALELSQRMKGSAAAAAPLRALRAAPTSDAEPLAAALRRLETAVAALGEPAASDAARRVGEVRAAAEQALEQGVLLRQRDACEAARLGMPLRPQELLDAFPARHPLVVVDLTVFRDVALALVVHRGGGRVRTAGLVLTGLDRALARHLGERWRCACAEPLRPADAVVDDVARALHDAVVCPLAAQLAQLRAEQLVLIADALGATLPIELTPLCPQNAAAMAEAIGEPAPRLPARLRDLVAVAHAPCLQALALGIGQRRPLAPRTAVVNAPRAAACDAATPEDAARRRASASDASVTGPPSAPAADGDIIVGEPLALAAAWMRARPSLATPARDAPVLAAASAGTSVDFAPTLLCAGAAAVLAFRWPIDPLAAAHVAERFAARLAEGDPTPATALRSAVDDLRSWPREQALARCRALLAADHGRSAALLDAQARLDDRACAERPFDDPRVYGAAIVVGCGWRRGAGGVARGAEDDQLRDRLLLAEAEQLIAQGVAREAKGMLDGVMRLQDGPLRAAALELMARAVWADRPALGQEAARREALRLLTQAETLAREEDDAALVEAIAATRAQLGDQALSR